MKDRMQGASRGGIVLLRQSLSAIPTALQAIYPIYHRGASRFAICHRGASGFTIWKAKSP